MHALVSGAIIMGYVVAALYFFRFWTRTNDRLFAMFGVAFGVLAAQRLALVLLVYEPEAAVWLYAVRALAFLLIVWAIIDKNRGGR